MSDIITPVSLEVVDSEATAALRSSRALQIPAVFRSCTNAGPEVEREFLTAFDHAHTRFLAELTGEFQSSKVPETVVASTDFGYLITAYNVKNRMFPVTEELASDWARGGDGGEIRERLLAWIRQALEQPICPDHGPDDFTIGQTICLVPVSSAEQCLASGELSQGVIIPAATVRSLSRAAVLFRAQFPAGEQLFARALSAFLKPNCLPDESFTRQMRQDAVGRIVVAKHYQAGDIIARRGEAIGPGIMAALKVMDQKLESPSPADSTASGQFTLVPSSETAVSERNPLPNSTRQAMFARPHRYGLAWMLAGVSLFALAVAGWQIVRERQTARQPTPPLHDSNVKESIQIAQAFHDGVVHELARQRRGLLQSQQIATDEIEALAVRFEKMNAPLSERLRAYETRIEELENQLAIRTQENRELLEMRIGKIRAQMEIERLDSQSALK